MGPKHSFNFFLAYLISFSFHQLNLVLAHPSPSSSASSSAAAAAAEVGAGRLDLSSPSSVVSNAASFCLNQILPPQIRYPPAPLVAKSDSHGNSTNATYSDGSYSSSFVTASKWPKPSPQDVFGTYYVSHSSRQSYMALVNFRGDTYPLFPSPPTASSPQSISLPPGSQIELTSWSSIPNDTSSKQVTTVFGYWTPVQGYETTYKYISTGPLANTSNLFAPLAYGVDSNGVGFRIDYETGYFAPGTSPSNADPCINIASRSQKGPSEFTLAKILTGLRRVGKENGDDAFVKLVNRIVKLRNDERRSDDDVVCDERCMQNADLIPTKK